MDTYPSQQSSEVKARLYLDLDGVIYPIRRFSETEGVDPADVDMLHEHADYEWWRRSIVQRIGGLGVEIVMSSSWGVSFMRQTNRTSPLNDLKPARALPVSHNYSKEVAVAEDLCKNSVPFVWIDDDINPEMVDYVKQTIPKDTAGLYVKPYRMQGLTHQELDAIERLFLLQI